jgi:hypothetical protein
MRIYSKLHVAKRRRMENRRNKTIEMDERNME